MRKRFLFLVFGSFPFYDSVPRESLFDTDILQHSHSVLKFSTRSVTINFFNWLERKNKRNEKMHRIVEGLRTGRFVTITNLTPHSCGCAESLSGKFFLQGFTPHISKVRKLLVSVDIGQHNALEISSIF